MNEPVCDGDYIFVYGTLRKACPTGAHTKYLAGATFIDYALVRGSLYRVSYYPALLLAEMTDTSAGEVIGEIYKLASAHQLTDLDTYEECDYPAQPEQEYLRQKITVITASGITLSAWVYCYQRAIEGLEVMASGDFLNP